MKTVVVDIGNSAIKLAIVSEPGEGGPGEEDSPLVVVTIPRSLTQAEQDEAFAKHFHGHPPCRWLVCSVDTGARVKTEKWMQRVRPEDTFYAITADEIELDTPEVDRKTLGRDRLLAAWAAYDIAGGKRPVIVVDAGTATTIDVVDQVDGRAVFLGGLILPGIHLSLKSLSEMTDALPDFSDTEAPPELTENLTLGIDTQSAVMGGTYQLHRMGVQSIVRELESRHPGAIVFATGGAVNHFMIGLAEPWKYVEQLVLQGVIAISRQEKAADESAT